MTLVGNIAVLVSIILSFIAGLRLDNYYQTRAAAERKDALERQFVRLQARADADDPCKPYGTPRFSPPVPVTYPAEPAQPISEEFMTELQNNGRAKTSFRKSDLSK
jgi:hypothetical protein